MKYTFSGHESFQCRQLWLKKGFNFINSGRSFNDKDAAVILGVGNNMVAAIRFWMKAFGLLTPNQYTKDDRLTDFAIKLFADNGWDPYLEDEASLWLLHYQLVKNGYSSIYSVIFNGLRWERIEFTKKNFVSFVHFKVGAKVELQANEKTLLADFNVFTKMYQRSSGQAADKEDFYSGILAELDLLQNIHRKKEEFYTIENTDRSELPDAVVHYAILDCNKSQSSISLKALEQPANVASLFALSRTGLTTKIEAICARHKEAMVFNDHAGIKELQIKDPSPALTILDEYYAN